ncbi:hypothetical protein SAMD00019534_085230 [Acytostelium subglobosum LB1]|uniref:hypothetical protein n=1 Tax=Acytostelium subglobosum LB1 TaxID=1410327 RepID=UPI00064500C4|nr:hypothetical protein SAMD00019534_085230 [Acytostelium subglobosum LB1]GAM25348.1 hypothetical protein SAMD00019534_085230 [Acytostelium subglobosum LB1]|eukprot:XP_012751868.1 hypothetical protein SAMD00019534_085230 [Acytostelium subglobosum LB1]
MISTLLLLLLLFGGTVLAADEPTTFVCLVSNPGQTLNLTYSPRYIDAWAVAPLSTVSEYVYTFAAADSYDLTLVCNRGTPTNNCTTNLLASNYLTVPITSDNGALTSEGEPFTYTPSTLTIKYGDGTPDDSVAGLSLTTGSPKFNFTYHDRLKPKFIKAQFEGGLISNATGVYLGSTGSSTSQCYVSAFVEATDNRLGAHTASLGRWVNTMQHVSGTYATGVFYGRLAIDVDVSPDAKSIPLTLNDLYSNPSNPETSRIPMFSCVVAEWSIPSVTPLMSDALYLSSQSLGIDAPVFLTVIKSVRPNQQSPWPNGWSVNSDTSISFTPNPNDRHDKPLLYLNSTVYYTMFKVLRYNGNATATLKYDDSANNKYVSLRSIVPTEANRPSGTSAQGVGVYASAVMVELPALGSMSVNLEYTLPVTNCLLLTFVRVSVGSTWIYNNTNAARLCTNETTWQVVVTVPMNVISAIGGDIRFFFYDRSGYAFETVYTMNLLPGSATPNYQRPVTTTIVSSSVPLTPSTLTVHASYVGLQAYRDGLTDPLLEHGVDKFYLNNLFSTRLPFPFGLVSGRIDQGTIEYETMLPPYPPGGYKSTIKLGQTNDYLNDLQGQLAAIIDTSGPALNAFTMDVSSNSTLTVQLTLFDVSGVHRCDLTVGPYKKTFYAQDMLAEDIKLASFTYSVVINKVFCGYPVTLICVDKQLNPSEYQSGGYFYDPATTLPTAIPSVPCPLDPSLAVPLHLAVDYINNTDITVSLLLLQVTPTPLLQPPIVNFECSNSSRSFQHTLQLDQTQSLSNMMLYRSNQSINIPNDSKATDCRLTLNGYTHDDLHYLLRQYDGDFDNPASVTLLNPLDSRPPSLIDVTSTVDTNTNIAIVNVVLADSSDLSLVELTVFDTLQPIPQVLRTVPAIGSRSTTFTINVSSQMNICKSASVKYFVNKACDVYNNCQQWTALDSERFPSGSKVQLGDPSKFITMGGPQITSFSFTPKILDPRYSARVVFTMGVTSNTPLSNISLPVVYLKETIYLDGYNCTMNFINSTHMTCIMDVPRMFARFLQDNTFSVYGLTSVCGEVAGMTGPQLTNLGTPNKFNYNTFPVIDPIPLMKPTDRSFILTGVDISSIKVSDIEVFGITNGGSTVSATSQRFDYPFTFTSLTATSGRVSLTDDAPSFTPDYKLYVQIYGGVHQQSIPLYYCPNDCTSPDHGVCQTNNICLCSSDWTGSDCSVNKLVKCASDQETTRCSGNGACSSSMICQCEPGWNGPGCDFVVPSNTSVLNVTLGEPNEPVATFSNFDQLLNTSDKVYQSSSFNIQFLMLQEMGSDEVLVRNTSLSNLLHMKALPDNTYEYTSLDNSTNNNIGWINVTIRKNTEPESFIWINETFNLPANTIKFTVHMANYPFRSKLNSLVLTWQMESIGQPGCQYGSRDPTLAGSSELDLRYVLMPLAGVQMYARFPNTVLVDSRPTIVSNRMLWTNVTTLQVGTVIPYFSTIDIDPDFSVLIESYDKSTHEATCSAQGVEKKDKRLMIILAVVIPFVVMAAIVGGLIYFFKYKRTGRIATLRLRKLATTGKFTL